MVALSPVHSYSNIYLMYKYKNVIIFVCIVSKLFMRSGDPCLTRNERAVKLLSYHPEYLNSSYQD